MLSCFVHTNLHFHYYCINECQYSFNLTIIITAFYKIFLQEISQRLLRKLRLLISFPLLLRRMPYSHNKANTMIKCSITYLLMLANYYKYSIIVVVFLKQNDLFLGKQSTCNMLAVLDNN